MSARVDLRGLYGDRVGAVADPSSPSQLVPPLRLPLPLVVTSGYGPRINPATGRHEDGHGALDLAAPAGTPILAVESGRVVRVTTWPRTFADWWNDPTTTEDDRRRARESAPSGNSISIRGNRTGLVWSYLHMFNPPGVEVGQDIDAGTVIGGVGSTGLATGPHLHLQADRVVGGAWMHVDPAPLFASGTFKLPPSAPSSRAGVAVGVGVLAGLAWLFAGRRH